MTQINIEAPFKYTFPISKAEEHNGKKYLTGYATGPEIDIQGERIHPTLIQKWATQINSGMLPVIYRDWHKKDSVTADLGVVTKAWVDENFHLGIEVELDDDNPVSQYLYKSVKEKGKKYGMSVYGKVHQYADEFVAEAGRVVRTFYDATLEEVSNTTAPVWTPSFGTVLSKAVDSANESADGDKSVANTTETPKATETVEETTTVETEKTEEVVETPTTDAPVESAPDPETVEKAITVTTTKKSERKQLVSAIAALTSALQESGLLDEEEVAAEPEVKKSEQPEDKTSSELEIVKSELAKTQALLRDLAERIPEGGSPALLQKSEGESIQEELSKMTPLERLRFGFAAMHKGE